MPQPSALAHFMGGARDTVPVGTAQLAPWQGQLMSLGVFDGFSQFIVVGLPPGRKTPAHRVLDHLGSSCCAACGRWLQFASWRN
ncbi:MAG: AzlC family protein [Comamonadaceae bacterium]|nr:MAG: AzlC family protein [Comamonadaceae bacterium]